MLKCSNQHHTFNKTSNKLVILILGLMPVIITKMEVILSSQTRWEALIFKAIITLEHNGEDLIINILKFE